MNRHSYYEGQVTTYGVDTATISTKRTSSRRLLKRWLARLPIAITQASVRRVAPTSMTHVRWRLQREEGRWWISGPTILTTHGPGATKAFQAMLEARFSPAAERLDLPAEQLHALTHRIEALQLAQRGTPNRTVTASLPEYPIPPEFDRQCSYSARLF